MPRPPWPPSPAGSAGRSILPPSRRNWPPPSIRPSSPPTYQCGSPGVRREPPHDPAWPLPLHERPDLRPRRVAHVDRGEPPGRLLQMGYGGGPLTVRVQQVGHVRVQGRHPVLVAEFAAELERLGRDLEGLAVPAR